MNKILNKFFYDISPLFFIGVFLVSSFVLNAEEGTEVESVTIIGTKEDAKERQMLPLAWSAIHSQANIKRNLVPD